MHKEGMHMRRVTRVALMLIGVGLAGTVFASAQSRGSAYGRQPVYEPPTLAILPFKNLRSDADSDWIGDAAAETVTTKLAGVPQIVVVERSEILSVLDEQDFQRLDITDPRSAVRIGRVLGAERLVVGSFAQAGPEINFNVRIVDVKTAEVLNTANLTGQKHRIFDTLNDLADTVIMSLNQKVAVVESRPVVVECPPAERIVISEPQRRVIRDTGNTSFAAFEAYGRGLRARSYEEQVKQFSMAIDIDQNFSLAFAARSESHSRRGRYDMAIVDVERATRINPHYAHAWYLSGEYYEAAGQPSKARVAFDRYRSLVPPGKAVRVVDKAQRLKGKLRDRRSRNRD